MAPACVFLPHDADARSACKAIVERIVNEEGHALLGWREVPIDLGRIGKTAASVAPVFEQLFIANPAEAGTPASGVCL